MIVDAEIPRFRTVMATGLPGFAREGLVPIGLFYLGLKTGGLVLGIALSSSAGAGAYLWEHYRGRRGLMAQLSLVFIAVQAVVGIASHSAVVYLAQPVLLNAIWGLLYLGSVAVGRPLMGAIAQAWYPFPDEVRRTETFRRAGSLGSFVLVNAITGVPITLALIAWSVRYAIRRFERTA